MKGKFLFTKIILGLHAICLIPSQSIGKNEDSPMYILPAPPYNPGFFSCFASVIGFLDFYKQQKPGTGIEVTFGKGLYFDEKHGKNWWEYYFEPIRIYNKKKSYRKIICTQDQESGWAFAALSSISRYQAAQLIKEFIRVKEPIKEKARAFRQKNFGAFTIGIHYRGTDKSREAPRVTYEEVTKAIKEFVQKRQLTSYKIFIATDEQPFISYMVQQFHDQVVYCNHFRSKNKHPIHYGNNNKYQSGKEALIDCLLLSRCNVLIRTQSNLSSMAANINPSLETITLNNSFYQGLR